MKFSSRLAAAAWLMVSFGTAIAQTNETSDTAALLKRIDEQEKRIAALERRLRGAQEAGAVAQGPSAAAGATGTSSVTGASVGSAGAASSAGATSSASGIVKAGPQGLVLQSADGANVIRFRGNLAVDGRWYSDDITPATSDTWLFRRVRPYVEGTLDRIYDFRFMPDFGNGKSIVVDAYVTGRFKPWLAIQAGKFKGPVGLERLQPDQFNRFLELGLPSALVPNRDLGVQVAGDLAGGALSYAIGSFIGVTDGNSTDANASPDADNDGKKDWEGRLFAQPFVNSGNPYLRGLGFGAGGTYVNAAGSATSPLLASYRTPGQQTFFKYRGGNSPTYADGRRYRVSPQLYYYAGSFGLIGEYADSSQDVSRQVSTSVKRSALLDNRAWQISLSYFLTGETASYNSYTPLSSFEPGKPGWGAWELAARYHELRIDDDAFVGGSASFADPSVSPRRATAIGVGLNWYLNQNVKWMLDYERTRFKGGVSGGDRPDEKVLLTRFSLVF